MEAAVLSLVRIALLALLWLFIGLAIYFMNRDVNALVPAGASARSSGSAHSPARRWNRDRISYLEVTEGPMYGSQLEIAGFTSIIMGRGASVDFTLGDQDQRVSARHARLFLRGRHWFIEDLESRNGTFVNNIPIDQPTEVHSGDTIQLGESSVRLQP